MTEETNEKKAIKEYLKYKSAFVYHNLAGLGVYAGIPDLTCISKGIVYQIEVKKKKGGRQSENQKQFQEDWEKQGGIYILGGIDKVIKAIK